MFFAIKYLQKTVCAFIIVKYAKLQQEYDMTKKIIVFISLLIACVCLLAGCASESFKFDALKVESMSGDLESNGGVSVSYKGYTYFINGNVDTYTGDNTFGKVTYGAICRVKTALLVQGEFAGLDFGSEEYKSAAEGKIEILAPKAVFTATTTASDANGIYIFDDRLYYFTPSTTTDKNGKVQNAYIDVMSVKLDGTDTKRLYTVTGNNYQTLLAKNGNDVCLAYVADSKLYNVVLTAAKPAAKEICDNVTFTYAALNEGMMIITRKVVEKDENQATETTLAYNVICAYKLGSDSVTEVITGKQGEGQDVSYGASLSVSNVYDGYIYFSVADADKLGRSGLYRISVGAKDASFATSGESYLITRENLLSSGGIAFGNKIAFYNSSEKYVCLYDIAAKTTEKVMYASSAPTLVAVKNGKLFYVTDGLNYVNLGEGEQIKGVKISSKTNGVNWATYDIYGSYVLFFGSTENSETYLNCAKIVDSGEDVKESFIGIYTKKAE